MSVRIPVTPAIQWHEGMLLSPQHLQQSDLRQQQILSYHLHRLSPHHWGVHHLKLDLVVVPSGIIRADEVEVILSDGLIYSRYNETGHPPLEINLSDRKAECADTGLYIYLCVPEQGEGSPVTGEWPRYDSIDGPDVIDDNAIDNIIRIPRLIPKCHLIAALHPPARFNSVPIAHVSFADETFSLLPFIPPCFVIAPNTPLGERCAQLAQLLREKGLYLIEKWQKQAGSVLSRETAELLRPIINSLPLLEGTIHHTSPHPQDLYRTLCEVAGNLATMRPAQLPPIFPAYSHVKLYHCFTTVLDWIQETIGMITRTVSLIPMHLKDRLFYLKMHPSYIFEESIMIGVKAPAGMTGDELTDWMRECVIATESFVEKARMNRITAAHRDLITKEDVEDLMPSRDTEVYRVSIDPTFINLNERLMIFHAADSPDKRPSNIFLYVRGEQPSIEENKEQ